MKFPEIKNLLEKYYNAESDLNEEKQLRQFFSSENVPVEMQASKEQFIFFSELANKRPQVVDLEDKIMANLLETSPVFPVGKKKPTVIIGRIITAIAAAIMLIFVAKSFEESFNNGMLADKLTTSINSSSCNDLQTCYFNTHDALMLMSAGINKNDQLVLQLSSNNSFIKPGSKSNKHAISVDNNKLQQLSTTDSIELDESFRNISKSLSLVKISIIEKDKTAKKNQELQHYHKKLVDSGNAIKISSPANNQYSVWIIDREIAHKLIFFNTSPETDILIEVSGNFQLSEIKNLSIVN